MTEGDVGTVDGACPQAIHVIDAAAKGPVHRSTGNMGSADHLGLWVLLSPELKGLHALEVHDGPTVEAHFNGLPVGDGLGQDKGLLAGHGLGVQSARGYEESCRDQPSTRMNG